MGDLVWVRNFFPKPLEKEFFSPTHNSKTVFFQDFTATDIFFQCRILFSPDIPLQGFFIPLKSVCNLFFLKSPIPALKVKWLTPKLK